MAERKWQDTRAQVTPHGYSTWECQSALQKAIRRDEPEKAMVWALELAESEGWMTSLIGRLRVIAMEDIGVGDMQAVGFALNAIDLTERWWKAKNSAWYMGLSNAVYALATARKCRLGDNFQAAIRGRLARGEKPEMPDEALDKHTHRGKKLGRGIQHFEEVGSVLNNAADLTTTEWYQDIEAEAYRYWYAVERGDIIEKGVDPQGSLL